MHIGKGRESRLIQQQQRRARVELSQQFSSLVENTNQDSLHEGDADGVAAGTEMASATASLRLSRSKAIVANNARMLEGRRELSILLRTRIGMEPLERLMCAIEKKGSCGGGGGGENFDLLSGRKGA